LVSKSVITRYFTDDGTVWLFALVAYFKTSLVSMDGQHQYHIPSCDIQQRCSVPIY